MIAGKQPTRNDECCQDIPPEVTGGAKIDTKSPVFQTGKAIIGGGGDVLCFIDDAAHEVIPNVDVFRLTNWA